MTAAVWDAVDSPEAKVERDRYGRPLIVPAKGGKPVPYTRVTTIADTLDDRYNLELWKLRQCAVGLMLRPDLIAMVAAQQEDKKALDRICSDALDASKAGAAANTGTALHALTERLHAGDDLSHVPEVLRADLDAYRACIDRHQIEVVEVEQLVVCEQLQAAGTLDRLMRFPNGRLAIGDLKTGAGAVDWGLASIAVQLAIYANADTAYDPASMTHAPRPVVDKVRAYVLHLPAGTARCELVEVDIGAGWEAAKTAVWVRGWRKRKNLGRSVTSAADIQDVRRTWLADRVRALPEAALRDFASLVQIGELPRVSQAAGTHLDDLAGLLDVVEANHGVPFGAPDPTSTVKRKRNA